MGHDGLDPQSYPLKLKAYVVWLNDEKIISIFQKNPACCYGKRNSNKLNVLHVKKLWFLMWYDVGNDKKDWNLIFFKNKFLAWFITVKQNTQQTLRETKSETKSATKIATDCAQYMLHNTRKEHFRRHQTEIG